MRKKYKGVALVGTVAAVIAWTLLAYGIFTVESSQFQMLTSSNNALNAQKLAEIDAALLKMVNYENVSDSSALGEVNLHLERGDIKSIDVDGGWQDEIIIGDEKLNKNDPDYGRFRVATVNIYKQGDTEPKFSMQVPLTKTEQTYSRKTIDEFIEVLRAKDRELEAKDRELDAKDRALEAKDRELEAKDKELAAKDKAIESRISSLRSSLLTAIYNARCTCKGGGSTPPPPQPPPPPPTPPTPTPTDDDKPQEEKKHEPQTLLVIDEWDGWDINFSFTAPEDGYIKLVSLEGDGETIEGSGENGTGSCVESYAYCIDGKVVELSTTSIDYFYRYTYIGDTTYEGRSVQMETYTEYNDDGSYDYEVEPTHLGSPTLHSSGTQISKGSTFTLAHDGSTVQYNDGWFSYHIHYAVVFVPK